MTSFFFFFHLFILNLISVSGMTLSAGRRRKQTRFLGKLSTERQPAVVQPGVPTAPAAQPSLVTAQPSMGLFDPLEIKPKNSPNWLQRWSFLKESQTEGCRLWRRCDASSRDSSITSNAFGSGFLCLSSRWVCNPPKRLQRVAEPAEKQLCPPEVTPRKCFLPSSDAILLSDIRATRRLPMRVCSLLSGAIILHRAMGQGCPGRLF